MEWLIGLIAFAGITALMWLFRYASRSRDSSDKVIAFLPSPRPTRSLVPVIRAPTPDERPRIPTTAEAAETLFEPIKRELVECRKAARKLGRAAEKALATAHLDPALIPETEKALARVAAAIEGAENVMDQLAFEDDGVEQRWWAFIEDIHDLEAEMEVAMSDLYIVHATAHVFR
ncbi:hypothetical protein [Aurantimonas endophytica]|uniref:hypothetical protein n=1 Tax=Aurantimonas endophytica TaxID=1522175 RepID=UPI00300269BE